MNNNSLFYDNVLYVTPMTKRFAVNPGATVSGSVTVINPHGATQDAKYTASVISYNFDENGEPVLDEAGEFSEIVDWVTIENPTGTVTPNSEATINYTITIPEDARGGDQYCAIAIRNDVPTSAKAEGLEIDTFMEISSVIYTTINGDITRKGTILENSIPIVSFDTPITLSSSYDNHGNVHLDALINVRAEDYFTGEILYDSTDTAPQTMTVMPNQVLSKAVKVGGIPSLGLIRVKQDISYNGEVSSTEQVTLVTPLWFLISVIGLIILTVWFVIVGVRNRSGKRYGYIFK